MDMLSLNNFMEEEVNNKKLRDAGIFVGVNAFVLDSGKYLVNKYEKYDPNLTFIIPFEALNFYKYIEDMSLAKKLNVIWDGTPSFMYGNYRISKKNTRCFELRDPKEAKHILVKVSWGGCFNTTRGNAILKNSLYTVRKRSNGNCAGDTYYIIPINSSNTISEDEI